MKANFYLQFWLCPDFVTSLISSSDDAPGLNRLCGSRSSLDGGLCSSPLTSSEPSGECNDTNNCCGCSSPCLFNAWRPEPLRLPSPESLDGRVRLLFTVLACSVGTGGRYERWCGVYAEVCSQVRSKLSGRKLLGLGSRGLFWNDKDFMGEVDTTW